MGHRAAVYSVCVHTKRKVNELKPLGSIDGKGLYLGDVLSDYFDGFDGGNVDGSKKVHCADPDLQGDWLSLIAKHGQSGFAADILDALGTPIFHQKPDHEHVLPCGSLFYLPRGETRGWWAVHINNGRSAKGLLESRMKARFKEDFDSLTLRITPVVNQKALDAAVEQDRVEKLKLRRLKKPSDIAAVGRWVPAYHKPSIALEIATFGKGAMVLPDKIKQFLSGDTDALDEIVEFGGLTFEEASVTIILPNGKERTINIQAREGGQAITQEMDNLQEVDGEPTSDSLETELRRSLETVIGEQ
jgi:hypothetical protein